MSLYKKIKQFIYHLLVPILRLIKYIRWKNYLKTSPKIQLVVGAGGTSFPGWFDTDIDTLDITNEMDFEKYFSIKKIDKILAEHVLEHLTNNELELMVKNFYKYSTNEINIRIAVPDGFHKDDSYIKKVKPGGTGLGAEDHKNLFDYKSLSSIFESVGFKSVPVEYWDENHMFHKGYSNDENGFISRSFINDERNKNGEPAYTSLIMDFRK